MPTMTDQGEYLTMAEAAEVAKVNYWTLRRWIQEGKLASYERGAGRRVYVKRADLEVFMAPRPRDPNRDEPR